MNEKIQSFDKPSCRALGVAVEAALKEVADRFGVTIAYGGGVFGDGEFKMKVVAKLTGEGADDAARKAFARCAPIFGVDPNDYGRAFIYGGRTLKLVGFDLKRGKYPIRVDDGGRPRVFVREILDVARAQWKTEAAIAAADGRVI